MKKLLILMIAVIAFAIPAASANAVAPPQVCDANCGSGGGTGTYAPCQWYNYGEARYMVANRFNPRNFGYWECLDAPLLAYLAWDPQHSAFFLDGGYNYFACQIGSSVCQPWHYYTLSQDLITDEGYAPYAWVWQTY